MKIYTKQGDRGDTMVYAKDTLRVSKDDTLLETYGTLDELNAHMGRLISELNDSDIERHVAQLQQIQRDLFNVGFAISASNQLDASAINTLELAIDAMQEQLPAQTHFILPSGTPAASQAHICRTVCRRAERVLVALQRHHDLDAVALQYINRLSDYLFVLARALNHANGVTDTRV